MSTSIHQQMIIRVPANLSDFFRSQILDGQNPHNNLPPTLIDVSLDTSEGNDDYFNVTIQGKEYPASLENLPTIVESHKTYDNKVFLKSGDIGQVLQVFHTKEERNNAYSKRKKGLNKENCMMHGLTPPTEDIVRRRFEHGRKDIESNNIRKVYEIVTEINTQWSANPDDEYDEVYASSRKSAKKAARGGRRSDNRQVGNDANVAEKEVFQTLDEEVVPFEEWMIDVKDTDSIDNFHALKGVSYRINPSDWDTLVSAIDSISQDFSMILEHPEMLQILSEIDSIVEDLEKKPQSIETNLENETEKAHNMNSTPNRVVDRDDDEDYDSVLSIEEEEERKGDDQSKVASVENNDSDIDSVFLDEEFDDAILNRSNVVKEADNEAMRIDDGNEMKVDLEVFEELDDNDYDDDAWMNEEL